MNAARWLSEGAETLVQQIEAAPDALHCEVLIVGSGYGGAVAAARLAGARRGGEPVSVFVLERGQEMLPGMFPATFAELPGHVRFCAQDGAPARGRPEGLFDLRIGRKDPNPDSPFREGVNLLLGNGLGGGSLINAAVMERPSADAFAAGWPKGINRESLAGAYAKAEAMLAPEQLPDSVPKLDSLFAAAGAMGAADKRKARVAIAFADGRTPAGVAMRKCLKCGDCVSGCNHRAKKSLDTNYLALGRANGARLFCGATVFKLRERAGGGYAVEFAFTDPAKARRDRERPYVVNARCVVLAAGALGSTEILLRSRRDGLRVTASEALGSRFSGNGDLIAVAHGQREKAPCSAPEGEPPAARNLGPTITGIVRHRHEGRDLVFEEFAIPAPLRRLFGEVVATTAALHGLVKPDWSVHRPNERLDDPLAVSNAVLDHTPVYGMMGDDGAAGAITLCDGPPLADAQVRVGWGGNAANELFEAQIAALRRAHEGERGLGGQVLPNPLWQPLPPFDVLNGLVPHGPMTTVHPLGGCPMADTAANGVVDSFGRVFADGGAALPGLVVLDGSIVPAALGINPALTIAALAERAVPVLAAVDWQLELRSADALQTQPRPPQRDAEHPQPPQPPQPTRITLRERMSGQLRIGGQRFDAQAVVHFAPVEAAALRRLPRRIEQPEVQLTLTDAEGRATQVRCRGSAAVLVRERSNLVQRVARSVDLVRRKLGAFAAGADMPCSPRQLVALCSHLGQVRLLRYDWTVTEVDGGAQLKKGERLRLTKRIEFRAGGNPWRQLSEGELDRVGKGFEPLGRLVLDPGYFAEQLVPLLQVESQQDQPNALGDVAELALWVLRVVLRIHLLNFLPPANSQDAAVRLPGTLDRVVPDEFPLDSPPRRLLSRYLPPQPRSGSRPVLLIHGYGASGSTFAHPSIPGNLVRTLLAAGRETWVLDLRTSIGLDQKVYWSFDEVARGDIEPAVAKLLESSPAATTSDGRVDVVAHCIGAAMFGVAVLDSRTLHRRIGAVVLSQVGPLLRLTAFNRFRGYVASYLQQFIGSATFDTQLPDGETSTMLIDGLLATFPYPDGDGEAERLRRVPGFAAVRHRADAIFGQTMTLANVGDETLRSLDSIYGWVMVKGLAQVIHYARERLLTDADGRNALVAFDNLAERFDFPLLMVHGRDNALFDWRGSYDTIRLLTQVYDGPDLGREPPPDGVIGATAPRQPARRLRVFDGYGHQDALIGRDAHRDVFPHIVGFLDEFADSASKQADGEPPLVAEWPAIGPTLGRVKRDAPAGRLVCRIALRPPARRASVRAVVFVPARHTADGWDFDDDHAALAPVSMQQLVADAVEVALVGERVADFDGFAVLTLHDDLPALKRRAIETTPGAARPLFAVPGRGPGGRPREAVAALRDRSTAEAIDLAVVHLDPAWIAAAEATGAPAAQLCFALASCQYPPGLIDRVPAQRSHERLARRVAQASAATRPQLLLLAGDQVYVDETAGMFDPTGADDVERAYRLNLALPALRRVAKSLPVYPLLDDHEVQDNWEPDAQPSPAQRSALAAYREYQHKLVGDAAALPFDYSVVPAGLPFFVIDVRSARQRRALRAGGDAVPLHEATIHPQLPRVLERLAAAPPDVPKFIVSSTTVFPLPHAALGAGAERIVLDDWSGYPRSQFELLDFIRARRIGNVVLLSGDRHMSSVSSLWIDDAAGPIEVVSVVSSGLYAPWPFANSRTDEFMLDGPVELQHGGRRLGGTMITAAARSGDGFAIVRVERAAAGGWQLDVALDLADGVRRCRRTLGDVADRRWVCTDES